MRCRSEAQPRAGGTWTQKNSSVRVSTPLAISYFRGETLAILNAKSVCGYDGFGAQGGFGVFVIAAFAVLLFMRRKAEETLRGFRGRTISSRCDHWPLSTVETADPRTVVAALPLAALSCRCSMGGTGQQANDHSQSNQSFVAVLHFPRPSTLNPQSSSMPTIAVENKLHA